MSKCNGTRMIVVLGLMCFAWVPTFGANVFWDGGGDGTDWFGVENWNPDGVPLAADSVYFRLAGTHVWNVDVNTAGQTVVGTFLSFSSLDYATNSLTLNIGSNGAIDAARINAASGSANTADIIQAGGSVILSGHATITSIPALVLGGHTANDPGGTGTWTISGGSLLTKGHFDIARSVDGQIPVGIFTVEGSASSITVNRHPLANAHPNVVGAAYLRVGVNGTYEALIDAGGITKAVVDGYASFHTSGTPTLKLGFASGTDPYEGTWTIMETALGFVNSQYLQLSGTSYTPGDSWNINYDDSGDTYLLTATYTIPEPTSVFLLSLGGLGLLALARRRHAH